jgi:cell division protein FtsQ
VSVDDDPLVATEGVGPTTRAKGGGRGRGTGGGAGGDDGSGGDGGKGPEAGTVIVDHRMRARRIGVRRDAGQRRLRRITLVLAAVAVLVGAAAASRSPLLDVDRVVVAGGEHTTADDVREAAGVRLGDALVSVDVDVVRERVERLPWVAQATVVRGWPSTLKVQVTERAPAALVPVTGDHAALVDREGRVLSIERTVAPAADGPEDGEAVTEAPPEVPAGLALLTGVGGPMTEGGVLEGDARDALRVAVVAAERMPGVVRSVSVALEAELVAGGVIRFGDAEELDAKVVAAKTVLEQVDLACLAVLDVRVPGSPALTRHQGCS